MKAKEPSREDMLSSCSEVGPEDGVDPRYPVRPPRPRVKNRKALQLCAQVAEVLREVFGGDCGDEQLRDLTVQSVVPAPDSSRLLVTLTLAPDSSDAETVRAHLDRSSGRLRSEVAAGIHRKRVPLLLFQIDSVK